MRLKYSINIQKERQLELSAFNEYFEYLLSAHEYF